MRRAGCVGLAGGWGVKVRYRCQATYTFWPRRGWSAWRCAV
jgi:hypothetical protein